MKILRTILFVTILLTAMSCIKTTGPTDPGYRYKVGPLKPSNIDYAYCTRSFTDNGCGMCHELY